MLQLYSSRNDLIFLALISLLACISIQDETPIRNFVDHFGRKPAVCWHDQKLGELLQVFTKERNHMAIVRDIQENDKVGGMYI